MQSVRKLVADVLSPGAPPQVRPDDSVAVAAEVMRSHPSHAVVVIDTEGVAIGIFTERDLLSRVHARELDPAATPVSEVMTHEIVSLPPDACITYAINRMGLDGLSNLPIVDASGRLVGLIGVRQVMRHLDSVFQDLEADTHVDDPDSPWVDLGGGA